MKGLSLLILRRVGLSISTVLVVITFMFVLIRLAPGDPVAYRYRVGGAAFTAEYYAELRHRIGLDESIVVQYFKYIGDLFQGDIGESFTYQQPVIEMILARLPATLVLMIPAMILGAILGTLLGEASARNPDSNADTLNRTTVLTLYSIPQFWLSIMLVQLLSLRLGLFPTGGMVDPKYPPGTLDYVLSIAWHAVLPVTALTMFYIALFARYSRASLVKESSENYVLTARAKGLNSRTTFRRHVRRNGLLPVVTLIGLSFRYLFGGAVLIEAVFSWPGIGFMTYNAILARDFPVIMGVFIFSIVSVVVVNLVVDLAYGLVDPRVTASA